MYVACPKSPVTHTFSSEHIAGTNQIYSCRIIGHSGTYFTEQHDAHFNGLTAIVTLSLGYICPDHRTIFRSAIFSTIFRHRRRSWVTTYVLTIHTGIMRFFDLPFVDVLIQKRKAIVRQSYVSADST